MSITATRKKKIIIEKYGYLWRVLCTSRKQRALHTLTVLKAWDQLFAKPIKRHLKNIQLIKSFRFLYPKIPPLYFIKKSILSLILEYDTFLVLKIEIARSIDI